MLERKVLLVDDNPVLCDALRAVLEAQPDFRVVGTAHTGAQAIELARSLSPDVVVLDVTLPDIRGSEVARRLKDLGGVRILALSAHVDGGTKAEMLAAGADA